VTGDFSAVCHELGHGSAAGGICSFIQFKFATSPPQALESTDNRITYSPGCSENARYSESSPQLCQPPVLPIVIGPVLSTPLNST
jgi:hypothetical protein